MTETAMPQVSKIQKLLLATDGSEFSEGASTEALKLAANNSWPLYAILVVESNPEFETLAPELFEKTEKEVRARLESIKSLAAEKGVDCGTIARHSEEPFRPIVEEAQRLGIDMIVMGRRGRTGLERLLMGSVTARVIGHAPCNVLVVPKPALQRYGTILVASDGSKFSVDAARDAVALAKGSGAKLVAVSVVPSETASPFDIVHSQMQRGLVAQEELRVAKKALEDLVAVGEEAGVPVEAVLADGRPSEAILETAESKGADLIVVGSHGRTGLERLLMGSVTERVVGNAECAVLVVKSRRSA